MTIREKSDDVSKHALLFNDLLLITKTKTNAKTGACPDNILSVSTSFLCSSHALSSLFPLEGNLNYELKVRIPLEEAKIVNVGDTDGTRFFPLFLLFLFFADRELSFPYFQCESVKVAIFLLSFPF